MKFAFPSQFFLLIALLSLLTLWSPRSSALCSGPDLGEYSRGEYELVDVESANVPCIDAKTDKDVTQVGPGCFLKLKLIKRTDLDTSKDMSLNVFANGGACALKTGSKIKKDLSSYCCDEDVRPVYVCGSVPKDLEPSKTKFCLGGKIYREQTDAKDKIRSLRALRKRRP